jgi:hypothetical protein
LLELPLAAVEFDDVLPTSLAFEFDDISSDCVLPLDPVSLESEEENDEPPVDVGRASTELILLPHAGQKLALGNNSVPQLLQNFMSKNYFNIRENELRFDIELLQKTQNDKLIIIY